MNSRKAYYYWWDYDQVYGQSCHICPVRAYKAYQAWYQGVCRFFDLYEILLGLKVYVVQEGDYDNTGMGICDDMAKEAGLTSVRGRTLYTNNYCMLMALANHMFSKYGWKIVVTIVPTDNKSRVDYDINFLNVNIIGKSYTY